MCCTLGAHHTKKPQNHRHHHWAPSRCRHWWINVALFQVIDTQEHVSIFPMLNTVNVRLIACAIVEGCDIFPLRTVIFPPADAVIIWVCICYDLCMKADVTQRSLYPPPGGKQLLEMADMRLEHFFFFATAIAGCVWNLHGRWFACLPQNVHELKVLAFTSRTKRAEAGGYDL